MASHASESAPEVPISKEEAESIPRSPAIKSIKWGKMEVDGLGLGRDFKLYPGGGREWDWEEYGTRHEPGIQPADVQELVDHGAKVIVLSRGMEGRLKTMPETLQKLAEQGVYVRTETTQAAVDMYNNLAKTAPVGGLFHSTC